ncbi:polysaccharide pyruvyl transferase family protein [Cellulophaga baltica]|uniref:polysaccharide pyruvyl transferase family protein n=1 Tax=Cellulophaga TaxID=104264 RepID=UPI001C06630A|nr:MULTISPECIES: polysaccharide pyruvyl transferase family protein [Cellulophaga]MBU2995649.1 polysaccharide pyruvyl transferase family protein [Cellulophaga baltica]MDO6767043.1 polysaccharide pyruvyl transferase family protein [Cellulophaga sp. 1_MG-2023]
MKKIGIITILNVNNYGAELQAFALHHKLKRMGYDNEIINYLYYKNPEYCAEEKSKPLIKTSAKNKLKDLVLKWLDKYSAFKYPEIAKVRKDRFDNFHKKNTLVSKKYKSYTDLYDQKHKYDTFIVGSDQVWNPNNGTNIAPYFLTFAPEDANKVSYASSFGVGSIDKSYYPQYKEWLNNLTHISTREDAGVSIIKNITDKNATHVVDPTLLLSRIEWEELMVPYESKEPYILFFIFKKNAYAEELAYKIQEKTGYKIIRVCKNEMPLESDDKILNIRDFGPAEFLGLYSSASIVLTTSFHGSVFSLIFEKPFYVITPANKNNNSRQESLLNVVDLKDRLLREGDTVNLDEINSINFETVNHKLNKHINSSVEFLKNSLD